MKRNILLLLLLMCFLTGCTKNYTSVEEYSKDMAAVRQKLGDYTIEAEISSNDVNGSYKSAIKGDKWRAEEANNNNGSVLLYDGSKVYAYSDNQNTAIEMPIKEMLKKSDVDNEKAEFVMKVINPVGILLHWDLDNINGNIDSAWQFSGKDNKNNYDCRMLSHKLNPEDKVCVSDKYGIAVYLKIASTPKHGVIEINVKNIDNTPISEQEVELPQGMKVVSMYDLFKNMPNMVRR